MDISHEIPDGQSDDNESDFEYFTDTSSNHEGRFDVFQDTQNFPIDEGEKDASDSPSPESYPDRNYEPPIFTQTINVGASFGSTIAGTVVNNYGSDAFSWYTPHAVINKIRKVFVSNSNLQIREVSNYRVIAIVADTNSGRHSFAVNLADQLIAEKGGDQIYKIKCTAKSGSIFEFLLHDRIPQNSIFIFKILCS